MKKSIIILIACLMHHATVFCQSAEILEQKYVMAFVYKDAGLMQQVAETGFVDAMYQLGMMCKKTNKQKAFHWLKKAAEQDYEEAQYEIGEAYLNGDGVEQSTDAALSWLKKSLDAKYYAAAYLLGDIYLRGRGIAKNLEKALSYTCMAIEKDNHCKYKAMRNLSYMYISGQGVERDAELGFYWLAKVAKDAVFKNEETEARNKIAEMYEQGYIVAKNLSKAYFFYDRENRERIKEAVNLDKAQEMWYDDAFADYQRIENTRSPKLPETQFELFDPNNPPMLDIVEGSVKFINGGGSKTIDAGEQSTIRLDVVNSGKSTARDCVAKIHVSGVPNIICNEVKLKDIPAKQTITVDIPVTGAMNVPDGVAALEITIEEPHGFGCEPLLLEVQTRAYQAPLVKVSGYEATSSNGGDLKKRVPFDLHVKVKNVGRGVASNITIDLLLPDNVMFTRGYKTEGISKLHGGEAWTFDYSLVVGNNYTSDVVPIKVQIREKSGQYAEDSTISLHIKKSSSTRIITISPSSEPEY